MKKINQIIVLLAISLFVFNSCGDEGIVKNTEKETYSLTYNISYNGTKTVKKVRAAIFDYSIAVNTETTPDEASGTPSSFLSFPEEGVIEAGVDFSNPITIKLEGKKDKKYLVVIYGDVDTDDGTMSVNIMDPTYILENFTPTEDKVFDVEILDQECTPDCTDKICGSDGCGGSCGNCGAEEVCSADQMSCEAACVPDCSDNKICGDDGCGGNTCGVCETGTACSTDQTTCEATEASYKITLTVNYSGTKTFKKIGVVGYKTDAYGPMPSSTNASEIFENGVTFPFTFSFDPTKDGNFKLNDDFTGEYYMHVYGTDGTMPSADLPQVKFPLTLPGENITETVELLDL
jgi:hypothetical protein